MKERVIKINNNVNNFGGNQKSGIASSLPNMNSVPAPNNVNQGSFLNDNNINKQVIDTTVLTAVSDPNTSVPLGPASFSARRIETEKNSILVPIMASIIVILVIIIGGLIALYILK